MNAKNEDEADADRKKRRTRSQGQTQTQEEPEQVKPDTEAPKDESSKGRQLTKAPQPKAALLSALAR